MGLIEILAYSHKHMWMFTYNLMTQIMAYSHSKEGCCCPRSDTFWTKIPLFFLQMGLKKREHGMHFIHALSRNPSFSTTTALISLIVGRRRPPLAGAGHHLPLAATSSRRPLQNVGWI